MPISVVISNLISFGIRLGMFLAFLAYYWLTGAPIHPTLWLLLLPVLILIMAGLGLGLGIIVSSLTTKYRDLQQLVSFGVQLLMYATPVIYPLSSVQGIWRWLLIANPMTAVIEVFRLGFLGISSLEPVYLVYSTVFMIITLLVGILVFHHIETTFMDTV
jgi:lipopolysaccharide transport system permease protein